MGRLAAAVIDRQKDNATKRLAADGTSAGKNTLVAVPATAKRCVNSFLRVNKRSEDTSNHMANAGRGMRDMMNPWRSLVGVGPWLRPVVLAAGMALGIAGCASVPDSLPPSFESPRLIPTIPGSKAEAEAFKQQVQNDPFPTAAAAGSFGR